MRGQQDEHQQNIIVSQPPYTVNCTDEKQKILSVLSFRHHINYTDKTDIYKHYSNQKGWKNFWH
jgi:hypothetical protein